MRLQYFNMLSNKKYNFAWNKRKTVKGYKSKLQKIMKKNKENTIKETNPNKLISVEYSGQEIALNPQVLYHNWTVIKGNSCANK